MRKIKNIVISIPAQESYSDQSYTKISGTLVLSVQNNIISISSNNVSLTTKDLRHAEIANIWKPNIMIKN